MPSRDDTAFAPLCVMATTTRSSQSPAARSGSAIESLPSARSPRCHSTNPPKIERAAEPEPRRASAERAGASSRSPAARLPARASAAKAAADDASPAPRGTWLRVVTRAASLRPASSRTMSRKRARRARSSPLAGSPSIVSSSPGPSPNDTRASTERPSRVSEMLPVAGRFSTGSRLPQYLTRATLTLERAMTADPVMRAPRFYPVRRPDARPRAPGPSCAGGRLARPVRGAQGREETRFSLVESLPVQGVAEMKIGIVEMVTELWQQRAQKGAVGDHLAALRCAHPQRDAVATLAVGGQIQAVQLAPPVMGALAVDPHPEPRHPEGAAHAVRDPLRHGLDPCHVLAQQRRREHGHSIRERRAGA